MLFDDFNFDLLNESEFKEDSVREELIAPLLRELGYSASSQNRIRRSVSLAHPFVRVGSRSRPINLIPDYLVQKSGKNFLVIDAKAPSEEIFLGYNVEQVFSYAIHPDVRTDLFALCNGRNFVLFHISQRDAIFSFALENAAKHIEELRQIIGTDERCRGFGFAPDLGLHLMDLRQEAGMPLKVINVPILRVDFISRLDEDWYSIQAGVEMDGIDYLGTFDFHRGLLDSFFESAEPDYLVEEVEPQLRRYPFSWYDEQRRSLSLGVVGEITNNIMENDNERYSPIRVTKFY